MILFKLRIINHILLSSSLSSAGLGKGEAVYNMMVLESRTFCSFRAFLVSVTIESGSKF
jgi:hypothetical protein